MSAPLSQQLKMFMSGTEWQGTVSESADRFSDQSMGDLWAEKEQEARAPEESYGHGAGVYESMKTRGYSRKLADGDEATILADSNNVMHQGEGHHRIAAAAAIERESGRPVWIPTNYEEKGRRW